MEMSHWLHVEGEGVNRTLQISLIKGNFNLGHWNKFLVD